jgi:cytochrome c oxidase subunit III
MAEPRRAHHFATAEQQRLAARLGMWVFMGSETLLFAALFGLYASYRVEYPAAFHDGMRQMDHALGAINTGVLLTSSLFAALSVEALERGFPKRAVTLVLVTVILGVAFLCIKGAEYADHIRHGMVVGGATDFFRAHPEQGLAVFVALYYALTGLHALHVTAGVAVLLWLGVGVLRGRVTPDSPYPLELGVLYWHLVDTLWVFLWPMFYFAGGAGS